MEMDNETAKSWRWQAVAMDVIGLGLFVAGYEASALVLIAVATVTILATYLLGRKNR
jgi:hypothetical protein